MTSFGLSKGNYKLTGILLAVLIDFIHSAIINHFPCLLLFTQIW
jgi:hypothetical protein